MPENKNNTTADADKKIVVIKRTFDVQAEMVFDAWLDPATVGRWLFATPDGKMTRVEIDARVGGKFTITEKRGEMEVAHVGEYVEISRPRRLVFDFGVPQFWPGTSRVIIDIAPQGNRCELTLTHEGVAADHADRAQEGWGKILNGLETNLEADREIVSTRVVNYPRELVWVAWSTPTHLAAWWGPNGFTNTFHEFDFRPGGFSKYTMHGPDGNDYPNVCRYTEIQKPERIKFEHLETVHSFSVTATFDDVGGKTKITFRMLFDEAAECQKIKAFCTEKNEENFDRLETELAKMSRI